MTLRQICTAPTNALGPLVAFGRFAALGLAALALFAAGSANAAAPPWQDARPAAAGAAQEVPRIQDEGGVYVLNFAEEQGRGMKLIEFVKRCQEVTGLNLIVPKESQGVMAQEELQMLGPKRVPKEDFYSFFQIIMFIHDFACVEVGPPGLSVIVIQNLNQQRQPGNIKQRAVYVAPEDLDRYADQPATLITTVINLPNVEVRALSNSLRALLTDNNTQNMLPAGSSNSIVLTGFGSNIVQLASLLKLIDAASAVETARAPVFDRVPLEFASAQDVANIITELLQAKQQAQMRLNQPRAVEGGMVDPARAQIESKIIVDARTNSLIVMALPEELPDLKDLIARIDTEVIEPERNYHVYALENVGSEELAETLTTFLSEARAVTASSGGTGGRAPAAAGQASGTGGGSTDEVVVVAEPSTNSLLIAANKTRYSEVIDLVRLLDKRQDQVLIETALIELTGNDFRDIGVELGLADIPGVGSTGGFGLTSFGLSTLEDLDGDGVPDARVPGFAEGITAGILDGDNFSLPFLVRLFQRVDSANVLSVPSILVNNNGSATVSTVDEQPTTTVTAFGGAGGGQTQENFNGYQEAGISLTISPSISASRYLRLQISLEVSNFLGEQVGSIPPARVTRRIDTVVNVPDGDTMVVGGVITNNSTETRRKTPFLGDIPLIKHLFQRSVDSEQRRTLYFFVTPHIMADRDFADLAELSYRKKLDASSVIGAERVRVIDPDFGQRDVEPELEAFETPLYSPPESGQVDAGDVGLDDPVRRAELLRNARERSQGGLPAGNGAAPVEPTQTSPEALPAPQEDVQDLPETQPEPAPEAQPADQPAQGQPR